MVWVAAILAMVGFVLAFVLWRREGAARVQLAVARDLLRTQSVRAESRMAVLEAEHDRLQTVLGALDDAVIVVGPTEEVRSVNAAALALFPSSFVTVRGRRVIEMTGDHEIAQLVRWGLRSRVRQEGRVELASTGRIVRVVVVPMDDADGNGLLLARDVTEIQHLQTVRREFVANVSHELRTPLGSIRLYVETLLDGGLDVPGMAEDRLQKVIREVDEMTQLVRELLDLARIESGREQPNLVPLDVAALVQDAVDRLEAQAERANVTLGVDLSPDLPPVLGDRRMLEGALVNLIHNAVKFTPQGGSVCAGAVRSGDQLTLWVQDTGTGIASEHLPRLFERFYKEDRARSGSGTGLGLAIVKHVALAHQGAVGVESVIGKGSRFMMHLPASTNVSALRATGD